MSMNVNGIGKQPCYEKANGVGKNQKKADNSFSKSLSENLNGREENDQLKGESAVPASPIVNAAYPYRNVVPAANVPENGKAEASESSKTGLQAVKTCMAKRVSYWESDYVKSYAAQGFALMAQVDVDGRSVYVEQKLEDGSVKGYEVSIDGLAQDTTDLIERMALEAWEKKEAGEGKELTELTVEEALAEFYEFIQDRIKNGPPKYMIGNSEFSVAEWDKLLEDFDDQLDALREEMRERIEKLREQQLQNELSQELQSQRDEVQDAEEEDTEEKLLTALFQNKSI
ncbi:MAG: hypothetical protein HDR27_08385 [Lachnospiraceae bacterium]|nr:hypothetical protein [Lachnospiraceae bacterium]